MMEEKENDEKKERRKDKETSRRGNEENGKPGDEEARRRGACGTTSATGQFSRKEEGCMWYVFASFSPSRM